MSKQQEHNSKDHGRKHYMDGVDEFVQALVPDLADEQEDEQDLPKKDASYYRRIITQRAKTMMQARGEWKLRKKSEKPKGQTPPKPTTPKTPSTTTTSKPRSNHGNHPDAPEGYEYWFDDYQPKGKGA
jgi:hypothetical protein